MGTFPGLDKDKLEQFRTFANQNPKDITLDLEAKTIWDGQAVGHEGKIGPWTIGGKRNDSQTRDYRTQFGMWKEVEETLGIPNPRAPVATRFSLADRPAPGNQKRYTPRRVIDGKRLGSTAFLGHLSMLVLFLRQPSSLNS